MSEWLIDLMPVVLRGSLFLTVGALLVLALQSKSRRPIASRVLWIIVLFQGVLLVRLDVDSQWLPASFEAMTVAGIDHSLHSESSEYVGGEEQLTLPLKTEMRSDGVLFAADEQVAALTSVAPPKTSDARTRRTLLLSVAGVWLAGIAMLLAWQLIAYFRFARGISYVETPAAWDSSWQAALKRNNVSNKPSIRATEATGPLVCRMPTELVLLVPRDQWAALTESQRETVMQHEIAHLQRGDIWKSAVARLLALPQWFNPFAWLAVRRFDDCAEWACDDATRIAMPNLMGDYARALLALGRARRIQPLASAASGRPLVDRIQRVLNPEGKETRTMRTKVITALVAVAALTGANAVRLVQAQQTSETKPNVQEAPVVPKTEASTAAVPKVTNVFPLPPVGAISPPAPMNSAPNAAAVTNTLAARKTASDEAVVDMPQLFKSFPRFDKRMTQLKEQVEKYDTEMKKVAINIAEKEDANAPNDELLKAFAAKRSLIQKELMGEESRIYLDVFQIIQQEIAAYARANGIRVVRRASTQPISAAVRARKKLSHNQIIEMMNRPIVFIDDKPRDITQAIIKRLRERKEPKEKQGQLGLPGLPGPGVQSKVPVLGDLPVVGEIFRHERKK